MDCSNSLIVYIRLFIDEISAMNNIKNKGETILNFEKSQQELFSMVQNKYVYEL